MFKNRKRLVQLALAALAVVVAVPASQENTDWPHLSQQEQEIVTALREANPPTMVAEKEPEPEPAPADPAPTEVTEVAVKRSTRKKATMVATAPEPAEEPFTVAPSHYRLRDTKVIRQLAIEEREEE